MIMSNKDEEEEKKLEELIFRIRSNFPDEEERDEVEYARNGRNYALLATAVCVLAGGASTYFLRTSQDWQEALYISSIASYVSAALFAGLGVIKHIGYRNLLTKEK